jgi:uncharacterized protein (TIGR03086 family)
MDLIDLFEQATAWTGSKIPVAASQLESPTPCDQWDVRSVLDHTIESQRYFGATARGEEASPPGPTPPSFIGDDPVASYEAVRQETLRAYREPGVVEKTGPLLGIASADQLVHGWDLARATGQDATMPEDLAAAALAIIDGQLTDQRRKNAFKPAIAVPDDAPIQDKLLGYTGRQP